MKLRLHLVYADGTEENIVTDKSWQWSPSEIVFNSIYGGEDYDARIKKQWKSVVIQEGPKGVLRERMAPPVKVMERFTPKSMKYLSDAERASAVKLTKHELPKGTFVLDMGQNLAGAPEISVQGKYRSGT